MGPQGRVERRLAAILCADVVGYSRLMGADEEGTLAALKAHRRRLIDPAIAEHRGRIVKTTGDGILAEFASVVDAVRCALEVQEGMAARNAEQPEDKRIIFRIGVNLGDVIIDGDDIFGDGVNVASRLEGLARPGEICLSRAARDQVRDKIPIAFEDMGEQTVKNIARPVRVFRVRPRLGAASAGGDLRQTKSRHRAWMVAVAVALVALIAGGTAFWMLRGQAPGPTSEPASVARMAFPLPDKPSIAVLPFDNLSGDPGQDYFSDGITEDIIAALSKFRALFVIARNSTFVYKGKPVKVQRVAEELGVRYVLEGSVRKAGDRVRISAQLIDAITGHHLWAERYDRALEDVFAVQDEVTQRIVAALAVEVSTAEEKRAMRKDTKNLEAYDYVLRAHQARRGLSQEGNAKARSMYEKAIELDPGYAKAYSFLAWTYLNEWQMWWRDSGTQSLERAFELAQKALALDNADPDAHEALGEIYLWKKQFGPAIAETERAVALNPNDADKLAGLADRLAWAGRPEEAVEKIQLAMRLNPNHRFSYSWYLGHAYFLLRRYDQAIATLRKVVDRSPDFWPAHIYLAASYVLLGRIEEARAEAAAALRLNPAITTRHPAEHIPYKNPADLKRLFDALEKVGVSPQS